MQWTLLRNALAMSFVRFAFLVGPGAATLGARAEAQCDSCLGIEYRASSGIVPGSPCWTVVDPGSSFAFVGGALHTVTPSGQPLDYENARPPFRWTDGYTMQARLRVNSGGSGFFPGFRAASYFGGTDQDGRVCSVYIGQGQLALSTDQNLSAGPGTALLDFDASVEFYTYTIVAGADQVRLLIDGVERLSLPYTSVHPSSRNVFFFGNDARTTGTTDTHWDFARFAGFTEEPDPVSACAGATAMFNAAASVGGPHTYAWRHNGVVIDPSTNPTANASQLVVPNAQAEDAGVYDCIVQSACGSAVTAQASLVIRNCCVADLSGSADPSDPAYGVPDGVIDANDFFYFLDVFVQGCP